MADALSRKSPATPGGVNRASNSDGFASTIANQKPEANFAALYVARRYRLAMPLAQAVAALAGLGRAFG